MEKFVLRYKIQADDKQQIITSFDLEFLSEASASETVLRSTVDQQQEKLIQSAGVAYHQVEVYQETREVFHRAETEIGTDHAMIDDLQSRILGKPRPLIKQMYGWQGTRVQINFLWLDNSRSNVEMECISEDLVSLQTAADQLASIGINNKITEVKSYKSLPSIRKGLVFEIFGSLIVVAVIIMVFVLLRSEDIVDQVSCTTVDVDTELISATALYCIGDLCEESCEGFDCHDVINAAECNLLDVVDKSLLPNKDGIADCMWIVSTSDEIPSTCEPIW